MDIVDDHLYAWLSPMNYFVDRETIQWEFEKIQLYLDALFFLGEYHF